MPVNSPDHPLHFPDRIGLGTSGLGESPARRDQEVAAVKFALDNGYRLIDTAEMYGEVNERVIGSALSAFGAARRSELFIISKVLPDNASRAGTVRACETSIERMGCHYVDLYLLHWRGPHPFAETVSAFDELLQRGLVRNIGVSNFSIEDLEEWRKVERRVGLRSTAKCNEVSYRIDRPGIEFGLLDWHRAHGIQTIGYGPLGQGELPKHPLLVELGQKRGVSAAQIALAWCLRQPDIITIPKSADPKRLLENRRALDLKLSPEELAQIEKAFPVRLRWLRQNKLLRQTRSVMRRAAALVLPAAARSRSVKSH